MTQITRMNTDLPEKSAHIRQIRVISVLSDNMSTPLVSIFTLAYNHESFIGQCMDGIVMQQTSFPFELLIHDDASTDATADIIREYETRYPHIIKPIYQTENQYDKDASYFEDFLLPKSQGKYIAICEGDDYWTDPLKLQKQIDFMETHPDYSICGGMYRILIEDNHELRENDWLASDMRKYPKGKIITLQNFLKPYCLQFLTICFRKDDYLMLNDHQIENSCDDTLYAMLLEERNGFLFPDYFGVYRKHQNGVWSGQTLEDQLLDNEYYYSEINQHFGKKSKLIRNRYFQICLDLRFIELSKRKHIFTDFMKIVKFTFSGKITDILTFQIGYFLYKTRKSVIHVLKKTTRLKHHSI